MEYFIIIHGLVQKDTILQKSFEDSIYLSSSIIIAGVLSWEITSGRPPFPDFGNRYALIYHLISKNRENPIENTPPDLDLFNIEYQNDNSKSKNNIQVIVQSYLKYNNTGWTKNYNFINVLKEYESESKELFNYLIDNPKIPHYEVLIGKFYQEGFGIDKNQQKWFKWFLKACERDDEHGKYEVGSCYYHSRGIEKSILKAEQYFKGIVDCGPNIALYKLANCYEFTISQVKEALINKAFQLYKTSAEKGFIPSQFKVAYHYSHGFYTQINEVEALKWYKSFHKDGGYPDVSDKIKKLENL
ncbi:896_t:CDS:2 [Funneliformis mosseae]|uniref:896_t:CDS:1 n=1 Tax=Funneliformis mosseae TaxID=27381 RepID=A0A9N8ZTA5_FUNMO|nr:896_t:CDS:2 [Funneliformis mosseae]